MKYLLLFVLPLTVNSMESLSHIEDNEKVCSEISTDEISGQKSYKTTYPCEIKKGLVRITDQIDVDKYPFELSDDHKKLNLIIKRHKFNKVIVAAALTQKQVKLTDKSEKEGDYKMCQWLWCPWQDDTITDWKNVLKSVRGDKLRGGNRLSIEICEFGKYLITVPHDADVEAKLSEGDISYESCAAPTMVEADATKIVKLNGSEYCCTSLQDERQSSTYDWGTQEDPQTDIKTKNGQITLAYR